VEFEFAVVFAGLAGRNYSVVENCCCSFVVEMSRPFLQNDWTRLDRIYRFILQSFLSVSST